jgi:hypothetical protein
MKIKRLVLVAAAGAALAVVGVASAAFPTDENFDGVVAPALPTGWTATSTGAAAQTWKTDAVSPNTAPNSAWTGAGANAVSTETLVAPTLPAVRSLTRLAFARQFALENSFDGVVLEVSVDGGAYVDATTIGTFVSGGYTGTISSGFSSPIGGRQAWTGSSAGYGIARLDVGASAVGHSLRFRWVFGSDSSVASPAGYDLDSILVSPYSCTTISTQRCLDFIQGLINTLGAPANANTVSKYTNELRILQQQVTTAKSGWEAGVCKGAQSLIQSVRSGSTESSPIISVSDAAGIVAAANELRATLPSCPAIP